MPNHFHLLIETPLANLSAFMQRLLSQYSKYFNRIHQQVGHVFQSRYKAILCDKESYFMELLRYIHLNPYRSKKLDLIPEDVWPWSSHRFYAGGDEPMAVRPWIHHALMRFGRDLPSARKSYAQFLSEGLKNGDWEDFYQLKGNRYLGSDRFVQETKRSGGESIRRIDRLARVPLSEYSRQVALQRKMNPSDLYSSSKNRLSSQARQDLVYLARRYGGVRTGELANFLHRDPSAISQMYRQAEKVGESPAIQQILLDLKGLSVDKI